MIVKLVNVFSTDWLYLQYVGDKVARDAIFV
jgi:hypothetical protein